MSYYVVLLFRVYRSNDFSSKATGQQLAQQTEELVLCSCYTYRLAFLLCDFCYVRTDHFRASSVLLILLHLTNTARDSATVFLVANDYLLPCLRESSMDVTQLNSCHLNAVWLHLIIQCARIRGDCRLACGVKCLERNMCDRCHRADVDDPRKEEKPQQAFC